jgi:hypothetical protein
MDQLGRSARIHPAAATDELKVHEAEPVAPAVGRGWEASSVTCAPEDSIDSVHPLGGVTVAEAL